MEQLRFFSVFSQIIDEFSGSLLGTCQNAHLPLWLSWLGREDIDQQVGFARMICNNIFHGKLEHSVRPVAFLCLLSLLPPSGLSHCVIGFTKKKKEKKKQQQHGEVSQLH